MQTRTNIPKGTSTYTVHACCARATVLPSNVHSATCSSTIPTQSTVPPRTTFTASNPYFPGKGTVKTPSPRLSLDVCAVATIATCIFNDTIEMR